MFHAEYVCVHILKIYTTHFPCEIPVHAYPNNLHITCFTRITRHNVGLDNVATTLQSTLLLLTNYFIDIKYLVSISHHILYVEIWCQ